MIFRSEPVGLPGLAALALGGLAFATSLILARRTRELTAVEEKGGRNAPSATIGVIVQGLGIGIASFGPQRVTLDPLSSLALTQAAVVAAMMAAAVALFVGASRAMGRNWSIRARTRTDHELVQEGPFRWVRNPIYLAMFLFMLALAIAFGHPRQLLPAIPVFAIGTWLRVQAEERLLRNMFGSAYDAYAARVRRFVPGVF